MRLDVRNLGGHLDFTRRAGAGTFSRRVRQATHGVAAVGALPLGFKPKLEIIGGKFLPAGLYAAEASYVSASALGSCRVAIGRALWSGKMPFACAPVMLNLLDVPLPLFTMSGPGFE